MKYKVRIIKQPEYQNGGQNFIPGVEDNLEILNIDGYPYYNIEKSSSVNIKKNTPKTLQKDKKSLKVLSNADIYSLSHPGVNLNNLNNYILSQKKDDNIRKISKEEWDYINNPITQLSWNPEWNKWWDKIGIPSLKAAAVVTRVPSVLKFLGNIPLSTRYEKINNFINTNKMLNPPPKFTGWTTNSGYFSSQYPFKQNGGEQVQNDEQQIIEVVKAYAQKTGVDPKTILLQLQKMQPNEQQQALQEMYAAVSNQQENMQSEEEMEIAEYGGQMGHALDLGSRRLYMNQNEEKTLNDHIKEVPREEANIEAEKGETIITPYKGGKYHFKIGGKKHSQGGTPLNVPEGSFVFSDTPKMRLGGDVLKVFGKSDKTDKKYTPAQLAKQYDINKYQTILNNPRADAIMKRTAQLMIDNYNTKLSQLAIAQEGKKGFPQGIPEIAKEYYNKINNIQEQGDEMQEEMPVAMDGMGFKYGGLLKKYQGDIEGSEVKKEYVFNPYAYNWLKNENDMREAGSKYYQQSFPFDQNNLNLSVPIPEFNSEIDNPENYINFEQSNGKKNLPVESSNPTANLISNAQNAALKVKSLNNDSDNNVDKIPYGWTTPDKLGLLNSAYNLASIKKATPWEPVAKLKSPEVTYYDPTQELSENAANAYATQQAYNMLSGPQARYLNLSGNTAKNVSQIMSKYAGMNVPLANQASQQQTQIANQQMQFDTERAKRLYDAGVIGEQQYQNAVRQARLALLQSFAQGHENAANLYNISKTQSPYFGIDPKTGTIKFHSSKAMKDFFTKEKEGYSTNYESAWKKAQEEANKISFSNEKQKQKYIEKAADSYMQQLKFLTRNNK